MTAAMPHIGNDAGFLHKHLRACQGNGGLDRGCPRCSTGHPGHREASVSCDGPVPVVGSEGAFAPSSIRLAPTRLVTMERTDLGCEIETALGEVLAQSRGETGLSCRIVDDPARQPDCRAPQAVAAEPAEVRRSLRSGCEGCSGMGTGPARSRSGSPGAADRHRS